MVDPEALADLLTRTPPFAALGVDERRRLAAAAVPCGYGRDVAVLVEDGPPADGMWLVVRGSVELRHDGQSIQILEPGECFGHPSLLTGMPPAYTVRTREETECAWFARVDAMRVLGTEAGAAYVAGTLRSRLVRQGHAVRGMQDIATAPVSAIMRPPRFIGADATVSAALSLLGEPGVTAVLVGDGEAIVTDADVRIALAEGRIGLDAPVGSIARSPAPTIPVGQLAVEAAVDLLAARTECVAVVDELSGGSAGRGGRVIGTLSAADLVGLDARSPIALRHAILEAPDEEALNRAVAHMPALFRLLLMAGVPPRDLGRVLSLQHDAIVTRLADFAISRQGPAPVAWAWLDLGSAARREFTLCSDQDNALAYAEPPTGAEADVDEYFESLGRAVNQGLERCGIGRDNNGVLAGERLWRMTRAGWIRTFDDCLRTPNESHLVRATVSFDFRIAAGGLSLTVELTERLRAAREHPDFMRLLARSACGHPVALGRRGRLAGGQFDEPRGLLDLKRGAIIPLVNVVRFHAVSAGVTISPTPDRIEAVASLGGLDRDTADALREAYDLVMGLRFAHHAEQIADGGRLDNLIDPGALRPAERRGLEEALQSVRRAQRAVEVFTGARL